MSQDPMGSYKNTPKFKEHDLVQQTECVIPHDWRNWIPRSTHLSWHCSKRDRIDAQDDALLALCACLDGLLRSDERILLPDQPVRGDGRHGRG